MGFDGTDVNWKCDAEFPEGMRFSDIYVGCEGYDYPEDPYVLRGSCQVVFSLTSDWYSSENGSTGVSLFVFFVIVAMLCTCCCLCKRAAPPQYVPVATAVDPVGAYPSAPPLPMNPAYVSPPPSYGYVYDRGGGGGYWSGMGTGGLLGYMFGRSTGHNHSGHRGWGGGGGGHHQSRSIPMTHHTGFARTHRR